MSASHDLDIPHVPAITWATEQRRNRKLIEHGICPAASPVVMEEQQEHHDELFGPMDDEFTKKKRADRESFKERQLREARGSWPGAEYHEDPEYREDRDFILRYLIEEEPEKSQPQEEEQTQLSRRRQRPRKRDTLRRCGECRGWILPGEVRCTCKRIDFKSPRKPLPDRSLEAAHFYHLWRSTRTGSWARSGHKVAHFKVPSKAEQCKEAGLTLLRLSRSRVTDLKAIEWFISRCKLFLYYEGDEFAGLMVLRLELSLRGFTQKKVLDYLQVPRSKMLWLDEEIRRYVQFPKRAVKVRQHCEELDRCRRMKEGVALRIIRQRQHADTYFPSRVRSYHWLSPFRSNESTKGKEEVLVLREAIILPENTNATNENAA